MKIVHAIAAAAALLTGTPTFAADTVIDFEGVASFSPVGDFYAPVGVTFSDSALALSNDELGPYFSNAPTPGTVMFAPDVAATMTFAEGFFGQVAFYYSSALAFDSVTIFSDLDGGGTQLATFALTANAQLGCSDTAFCNWDRVSLSFDGVGKSIVFGSNGGFVGYDNVTITAVPEPSTVILLSLGLSGIALARRRKSS